MSLILSDSKPQISLSGDFNSNGMLIDGSHVPADEMNNLIVYYLTNTDLLQNDLRIDLLEKLKNYKLVQGYNAGSKRISLGD